MVAAFGTGLVSRRERRWHIDYPCLDRRVLVRSGALRPGRRTSWLLKGRAGLASAISIELTAAPDGLAISTNGQRQVVHYWYDTVPCGSLRQFFRCPTCGRICKLLYFDQHWGCRVCLGLRYPFRSEPAGRIVVALQIEAMQRELIELRPGSRQWKDLHAKIIEQHKVLTAHFATMRRDLKRRLRNDYNGTKRWTESEKS